jgi:hypothetical protein
MAAQRHPRRQAALAAQRQAAISTRPARLAATALVSQINGAARALEVRMALAALGDSPTYRGAVRLPPIQDREEEAAAVALLSTLVVAAAREDF